VTDDGECAPLAYFVCVFHKVRKDNY